MGVAGFVAFQVLDPVEALVAGGAKETFRRLPLDGCVVDRNRWGMGIEDWDGAYGRVVNGWPRAERSWPGAYDRIVRG